MRGEPLNFEGDAHAPHCLEQLIVQVAVGALTRFVGTSLTFITYSFVVSPKLDGAPLANLFDKDDKTVQLSSSNCLYFARQGEVCRASKIPIGI